MKHQPVLLEEVLDFLAGAANGVLLDATVGLGGHAAAFLELHPEGRVIGIDRDGEILVETRQRLKGYGERVVLRQRDFAGLGEVLDEEGVDAVDAVLFDLGVSSPQLETAERGFSFRADGELDMRMDRSGGETAAELVARLPEKDLGNLLYELGGERSSRRVAAAIVAERRRSPIRTTGRLAEIVRRAVRGRSRIDAATRTFQALRMAVNDELGQLEAGLREAVRRLRPGGRIVTLSFHSGEDRIVKNFFRSSEDLDVLTKKVVRATPAERKRNPRSRSAKLRAAERRNGDA